METVNQNGITLVTGVTKADSGFEYQKPASTTYFCANGKAITVSDATQEGMGFKVTWEDNGTEYSIELEAGAIVCGGSWDGEVESTSITVVGGVNNFGIFGGGATASSKVTGDVSIVVLGGTLGDGVVGGGICGSVDGNVAVTIGDDENGPAIQANIIGGGFMETAVVGGDVSVTINNVTMPENSICTGGGVFGDVTGAVSVVVTGGELGYLAGGSMGSGSVDNTNVRIQGGSVVNVFGGGQGYAGAGTVKGDAVVEISGGTVVNGVWGGSCMSGVVDGNASIEISGGTIGTAGTGDVIYGGANAGEVGGTTSVNIITTGESAPVLNGSVAASDIVTVNGEAPSVLYVNSAYATEIPGEGKILGFNAFADFASAMAAARDNDLVTRIEIESDITTNSNVDTDNYYDIAQKLTIGAASGGKYTVSAGSLAILVMGDGASLTIEDGVTVENLDVVADGFATSNEEMIINGEMKALSLKVWTSNNGITVNETGKVALGYGDGQLDLAYGNGYLTVNGTLENTKEESLTDGPQFKAGYSGTRGTGNTINLNDTYFEGGAWFKVEGSNGTFNLDNSVMKIGGGDSAGSLTVSSSGNVFNVNNGSRLVVANLTLGANNTISLDGSSLELKTLTNNGAVNFTGTGYVKANVSGSGWIYMDSAVLDEDTNIKGGKVRFTNGTSTLDGVTIDATAFQVGIGAYNAKDERETVADVVVNVTNNSYINSPDSDYNGWIGTGYYDTDADKAAAMTDARYILNVENSVVRYGYLHVSNDGVLNVTGNADEKMSYAGVEYSFWGGRFILNGVATFDSTDAFVQFTNVSANNGSDEPGKLIVQNGAKYVSWMDSSTDMVTFQINNKGIVEVDDALIDARHGTVIAADASLEVKNNGTFKGKIITNNGTITVNGGNLIATSTIANAGTITVDAASTLTAGTLTGEGTITIDATGFTGVKTIIDLSGTESLEGKVTIDNLADGVSVIYGKDGDVALSNVKTDILYVDAAFTGDLGKDLGDGKYAGINAFATVSEALAAANADTQEIRVSSNITEALSGKTLSGSIVKDGETDVTVTDSVNGDYVTLNNASIGDGVTVDAKYIFLQGTNTIDGNVKSASGGQFWHGYGAKTTINGSVETYNTFNRYGSDISIIGTAEAGKGKEAEFQYKATGYLATYSGVVTVKDSAAQVAYVNLGTAVDSGYSPAKIVLDNALLKTTSGPNGQVGQMYVQNGASVEVKNDSVLDLTGTNGFGYLSMHEGTSLSLTDSALLLGKEGNGSNVLDGSVELVNSTITTVGTINNGGSITIDATSLITAKNITGTGSIVIDATELDGIAKVIDLNAAASLEGKVTILGDGVTAIYGADGDVTITNASTKTVYYDAAWAGKTAGEDLGDGKVFGVNAFSEFVDNGKNSSGWSNLLILPEDTTEIVLAAGNADDAEYGKLRPTQDLVVKTSGEGYAVVDRIVNMGVDLVIDEDAKVKVLTATGLSGANNQGGALIVNGELYFANANSSNKAIYLWGMNSTPGELVINAGGLLKADAGNIENHGTVTVLGTMELGKAGDAPKLAGVGTPGNGGWDGHLIVDGKDGEGILNVKHNQINFGGGNTSVDWIDAPNECSVDIINGGKITTAAVTFRNGKNNVLNITDGTFEFTDDADYANLTPRYFDNQGEILVGQDGVVDMNNRTFTNDGYIKLSSNASMSATKFVNNNVVELNDFNGTLAGMVKGEGENASGSIKVTGDTTIADTIDASMISVGAWDEFAEGVAANDKLTIAEAGKVSVANAYVQPGGELDIDGELNVTGGYNGVDGIFANYGKVNVDGKLNITTDASCGENLIGNLELDNSEISLTVAEGGELNINTTEGQSKNTLNVVNGAKLDVDGTFNADANTVINNTGVIEVGGEFTSEGTVNLGAYLIFDGLTAGDARELTVALLPSGATEGGESRKVTIGAGETSVKFYTTDLVDGTYDLTIVDGTDVLVTETTVTNGTIDVADGKISLNGVSVGNGSFNVTGASSVSVANLNGTLNIADAQLTESNINKGSVIFEGDNTYSGDFNASYAFVGDWEGGSFDGSVDFGTDSNVSVGGQMIIGYDSLVAGANTVTFGDADGEATDKVFYSADVSVRRDSVLTIANTTGNNKINTMNVMGKVILDNAKLSGEVQIGYKNDDMGVEAEVIVQNGAEYTIGGSSNSIVVIGKSSGGKLTVNDATVTVSRCGYGSSYTDLPQDKLVIGYNGAAGVVTVENNANFNALYSVLVNEGSSITVDDSNFSVGVTLYNYGSVTISGNSTVKANVVGDITVTDGTVFSADTALTVDGMINASGTVTATWNTVSGSLTADTIVLTGVELPTDADIVVYSGKADIKNLVINGSTCADNSIVINNELYDVEITDSAIVLSTSDSDYTPISGAITSVTQTAGTYTFTVAADITGGSGAEDYTYSYTVTDSTGKEFNAVANGLEFTLTDVPAAGKLNVSMTVTDAYGETTKYTTDAFAADVADYTAPKIDMLTSVAGKDINVSWIATDETGVAGYEIECNGQVYNLKFPVTGEAVGFDFLDLDEGKYSITVSAYDKAGNRVSSETSTINLQVGAKLLDNGVSQIVAWDAGRGAAGYIATDVDGSAKWVSVGYGMADIWDVVATGKFAGSTVDNDGLLLYNKVNNTFAAWTDLSNATHGYKSLCWVESDFATKCTANLDGDGFDDVLIYNTEGSFGAVLGAATYKDIWHVSDAPPTVELIGAGTFGHEDGLDSLVVKNLTDGSYEMWHNSNINGKKWGWGKVTITPAVEGWEVAAIGDFSGDGIDDIAMWNSNDGEVVLLENGKNDEQTVIGTLNDSKWEISAVGDYNGDGKEDLLLRELTSGYGGLYFANGGDLSSITSLGSSIATDVKDNKFAIIA